jgi:hypothetical protein
MGWASVVLEPMTKMALQLANSGRELVMAPEPKAAARPTTVELCQRRAQWSTLLVPSPARVNFWIR